MAFWNKSKPAEAKKIARNLTVIAVHGEADRDKLNKLRAHEIVSLGHALPDDIDVQPKLTVVLRDDHHHNRIELVVDTWEEVEELKRLVGYDSSKGHWAEGAQIAVAFG